MVQFPPGRFSQLLESLATLPVRSPIEEIQLRKQFHRDDKKKRKMSMSFEIQGLKKGEGEGSGPGPSSQGMTRTRLNLSLSRLQTFVSLAAGIVSITGALVAIPTFFKLTPKKGELVVIVQDAKTEKAVSDAMIDILTPQGALVTTLTPNSFGKASCPLEEGHFRVRVTHPRFGDEVREVQVASKQSMQIRVPLRASSSLPRSIRRLFGH
jgi:hypothetical protein